MEVRVEYDYEAQEKDELNLVKGEIISNVVPKIDGWYEGTSMKNGKRGLFPDNFVVPMNSPNHSSNTDEVFTDQSVQLRKNPNLKRYKTLFSYNPEQEDELRLEVGDIVEFLDIVEEGWFRGRKGGKIGIFPSNFVTEVVTETNVVDKKEAKTNILNSRADSFSKSKENRPLSKIAQNKPDVVPDTKLKKDEEPEEVAPKLPPKPVREIARCFYPYLALNDDELTMNEGDIITIISKSCEDEGWFRGELKGKVGLFPDNFVKLLTPNEVKMLNINSNSMNEISSISVNQPKITAQERNVKKEIVSTSRLSIGDDVSDGSKTSKLSDSNSGKLKKESSFPLAKELVGKPLGQIISRFSYKEKDTSKDKDKDKDSYTGGAVPQKPNSNSSSPNNTNVKREQSSNIESKSADVDEDDFNFVERGEMLNQLNAERAKPPKKRRPPSAIIKENGHGLMNGTSNSLEQSEINTSPLVNHTAINNSNNMSTSTPPTSLVLDTSKEENTSSSAVSPTKPKGTTPKIAPWMAELREKQDRKRETTPTNEKSPSIGSPTSTTAVPPMTITRKEKEPIKAPPLPQKPPSNNTSLADISNTSSTSVVTPPTTHFPSTKFGKRPSPVSSPVAATPPSASLVTTTSTYINTNNSTTTSYNSSTTDGHSLPNENTSMSNGTTVVSINNKQFVSIEEFCKLKDRVSLLEGELDLLRKQMRLLLDRDMTKGHIV